MGMCLPTIYPQHCRQTFQKQFSKNRHQPPVRVIVLIFGPSRFGRTLFWASVCSALLTEERNYDHYDKCNHQTSIQRGHALKILKIKTVRRAVLVMAMMLGYSLLASNAFAQAPSAPLNPSATSNARPRYLQLGKRH